jgi:hypothetical protein
MVRRVSKKVSVSDQVNLAEFGDSRAYNLKKVVDRALLVKTANGARRVRLLDQVCLLFASLSTGDSSLPRFPGLSS